MKSFLLDISPSGRRRPLLERVDPRTRVLAVILFSVAVAAAGQLLTLGAALGVAAVGTAAAGVCTRKNLKRLIPVNALVLALVIFLVLQGHVQRQLGDAFPVSQPHRAGAAGPNAVSARFRPPTAPGRDAISGFLAAGPDADGGLRLALVIALKANAIVLGVVALLAGLDSVVLGHALGRLGMPQKLTHLLLFTIRYQDVLHREYLRLRAAMKVRGFRPRANWHTYRTMGYLVGMLLVRSLDRSERIMAAMKCRGFHGRFYLLDHFAFSVRDAWFSGIVLSAVSLLVVLEWL